MKQKTLKIAQDFDRMISHSMVCRSFASDFDAIYSANDTTMLVEGVKLLDPECDIMV